MPAYTDISPRLPSRKAAVNYAIELGYKRVGKQLIKDNRFAVITPMPASKTFKVIEGVPV